jgi:hypothetical protein
MKDRSSSRFLHRRWRRLGIFLAAALLIPWLVAFAPSIGWTGESDLQKSVTIGVQETIEGDLYLAAEKIAIEGTIKGDAVVAARQIEVNGTVEGDLIAAGRVVKVNGTVKDDIRMAGQALILGKSARIGDGVVAAGYSLEGQSGSTIGGNLDFFGGQGLFAGSVQKNLRGAAAAMQLAGQVEGDLKVIVGDHQPSRWAMGSDAPSIPDVPAGLTLTDTAQVGGEVSYRSPMTATIAPGAKLAGRVTHEDLALPSAPPEKIAATNGLYQVQRWLSLALVGWLLLRFVPNLTQNLAATIPTKPLHAIGWGIVAVGTVVAAGISIAIATFLLLGICGFFLPSLILPILGLGLLAWLTLLIGFGIVAGFLPPILVSLFGGKWLMAKLQPHRPIVNLTALLVGLLAFVILTAIPFLGGILNAIAICLGLGSIWLWWRNNKGNQIPITSELPIAAIEI